jgi:two-component system, cell cycle sensor histidine kinase DivJ
VGLLTPVWNYVDALVPLAAKQDALTAARHRAFIAPRLLGSFVALVFLPIYLAIRGVPGILEFGVLAWLVTPILSVYYLSRTGRYEAAHILSSVSLAGVTMLVALYSGGISSFATIWLVVAPLEAALAASRRVVIAAAIISLAATAALLLLGVTGLLPPTATTGATHGALAAVGLVSAVLYATGLGLGAESLARTGVRLLYEEENRYRLLARNMTDVIVRHGDAGSVQFISPAAERLFGVSVNDLVRHGLFERVHVADRPAYLTALADAASLGEERALEFRIQRDAGANRPRQFVWVEMQCRPLDCSGGTTHEVVAVLRDINKRKSQERAFEAAHSHSERASAAKSRFIATMSHELRTPLNAVIGFSEIMMNSSPELGTTRRMEYSRLINASGQHLLSVVNGILDASKIETGNFAFAPEPFAPIPEIESCAGLLALKAREAGVDLKMRLGRDLPDITADRRAFHQILINLISNAVKFTPRGGHVTIGAACEAQRLNLSVEDTGVGICEADLARVGEAFFQASASYDRRYEGTGLGLSIVKGLVKLHGGDIDIWSRLGEGTRVKVRLPLEQATQKANDPVKLVNDAPQKFPLAAKNWMKKSA